MSKPFAPRRLYTPRTSRTLAPRLDPEAVAESNRTVGRVLHELAQRALSVGVLTWIVLNLFAVGLRWDPYPFILLNLAFSTQASYAAPLILLAQNRQEKRDRAVFEEDRRRAAQTKADTEYNARELAALRLAIGEVPTRDYLRHELDSLRALLAELQPTDPDVAQPRVADEAEQHAKKSG
ncbi:conserved hypothetical protein [Mycobacterium tuberculosis 02_1987]|nr:conserved hypothetical protein [Mycobacterium tuberculosis 02_1987]